MEVGQPMLLLLNFLLPVLEPGDRITEVPAMKLPTAAMSILLAMFIWLVIPQALLLIL